MTLIQRACTPKSRDRRGWGFTLVELLVVIAILGVLLALLIPAVQEARESSRRNACVNNLKQHITALHNHHGEQGRFPPGGRKHETVAQPGVSWRVLLLPFLEEESLYDRVGVNDVGGFDNQEFQGEMPAVYACPSAEPQPRGATQLVKASYEGVAGAQRDEDVTKLEQVACGDLYPNGAFFPESDTRLADITDGSSHTLVIGERAYVFSPWMTGSTWIGLPGAKPIRLCSEAAKTVRYPLNARHERWGYYVGDAERPPGAPAELLLNDLFFGSHHRSGANFGVADGSVRFLNDEVNSTVFEDLATISGGEITRWSR